jgi:protein FAM50
MDSDSEARRKKLAKMEKKRKSKLSFAFDDADDTSEAATPASTNDNSAKPSRSGSVLDTDDDSTTKRKRIKLGKDPSVNTSFLPDREREEQERIETEIKRKEWQKRQEEIKAEEIEIQFAFFDGLSHIGSVTVKKGEPIYNFLERAKKSFQAIRDVSADKLMFAKDDIIIPHELTFYFFEAHQVNGKHGPLFDFYDPDAPTKPRNKNDVYTARLLANEPRLGKIVTRKYLENNKHIYPCSRWELYDPEKDVTSRFV